MNSIIIGQHIRDARKAKELTQEELGQMVYADGKYISRLENGKSMPSLKRLVSIARILGVTCDYFVWDIDLTEADKYGDGDSGEHCRGILQEWREYA